MTPMIRILESKNAAGFLRRRGARMREAERVVEPILEAVRRRGDRALLSYARRLDGLDRPTVRVPRPESRRAGRNMPRPLRRAIAAASRNIRAYARFQLPAERHVELRPGLRLGQVVRPLDAVAAYIPSGTHPLPSTLLMTVIPAQVAGVRRICVATPKPDNAILGTASLLGVDNIFLMGGSHAIAAFAFGTETVPRVDRIVGPGNIYVAAAKKLLAGTVGIDFVAGPTEIVILAAEGDARILAADMLAQAEHDADASAVLLTTSKTLAHEVAAEIRRQLKSLPTAGVAARAIARNSAILCVRSLDEGIELANGLAPEHLSIPCRSLLKGIHHAGSVFIGPHSPEAAGDYASGPNHVLPTGGAARLRGGLSAADFVKIISIQQLDRRALVDLAPAVLTLARAEGLEAHARSVEVRIHESS
jgi:histidinol dehydrogenase